MQGTGDIAMCPCPEEFGVLIWEADIFHIGAAVVIVKEWGLKGGAWRGQGQLSGGDAQTQGWIGFVGGYTGFERDLSMQRAASSTCAWEKKSKTAQISKVSQDILCRSDLTCRQSSD